MRTTVEPDLTRQTKQWNRIQIASALTLFISLDYVVSMLFDNIKNVYTEQSFDYTGLLFQIPLFLLALFMIWQTWKHGSLFSRHSFKKLRYAFGIAAFMMLLLCTVIEWDPHVRQQRGPGVGGGDEAARNRHHWCWIFVHWLRRRHRSDR